MNHLILPILGIVLLSMFPTLIYTLHHVMKKPLNHQMAYRRIRVYCVVWFVSLFIGVSGFLAVAGALQIDSVESACGENCAETCLKKRVAAELFFHMTLDIYDDICWNKHDKGCVKGSELCYTADKFVCDNLYFKKSSYSPIVFIAMPSTLLLFLFLRFITLMNFGRKEKPKI